MLMLVFVLKYKVLWPKSMKILNLTRLVVTNDPVDLGSNPESVTRLGQNIEMVQRHAGAKHGTPKKTGTNFVLGSIVLDELPYPSCD